MVLGVLAVTVLACASPPRSGSGSGIEAAASSPAPAAAAGGDFASIELLAIDPPAPAGSTAPAVAAEDVTTLQRGHDVLMTWLEPGGPGEPGTRLRFARLSAAGWTQPITVADGIEIGERRDRPSLAVLDTQGVRRTLVVRAGDVVARSGDAGRTWARLPAPALPFASFAPGDEGGYAFWLAAGEDGSDRLLGARVLAGETVLDPRVAAAAGTSAAMTWDGPVVVYRDETADGARTVSVIRREDARWTAPRPVHREAWRPVAPRPESGPRVAAREREVAVAWYTASEERPRVLIAFSADAGRSFGAPVEVAADGGGRGVPTGFVDLVLADDGDALVVWTAGGGPGGAELRLARVAPDGGRGGEAVLAESLPPTSRSVPQIARAGDRVVVAWVAGAPARVRAVSVPLAGVGGEPVGAPAPTAEAAEAAEAARAAPPSPVTRSRGRVGEAVPDLALRSLAGEEVSVAALRGRAVLLNLWATWCMPCIAEMPELAALGERYGEEGLTVVGLSVDDAGSEDKVHAFVAEREIPFTVWLDPDMRLFGALRVRGLPATFVLDRDGRIVARRDGPVTADDPTLEAAIRQALTEP